MDVVTIQCSFVIVGDFGARFLKLSKSDSSEYKLIDESSSLYEKEIGEQSLRFVIELGADLFLFVPHNLQDDGQRIILMDAYEVNLSTFGRVKIKHIDINS